METDVSGGGILRLDMDGDLNSRTGQVLKTVAPCKRTDKGA